MNIHREGGKGRGRKRGYVHRACVSMNFKKTSNLSSIDEMTLRFIVNSVSSFKILNEINIYSGF